MASPEDLTGPKIQYFEARKKVFPKAVDGTYRRLKWAIMAVTLAIHYVTPWLRWNRGPYAPDQAVLIDIAHRRFFAHRLHSSTCQIRDIHTLRHPHTTISAPLGCVWQSHVQDAATAKEEPTRTRADFDPSRLSQPEYHQTRAPFARPVLCDYHNSFNKTTHYSPITT